MQQSQLDQNKKKIEDLSQKTKPNKEEIEQLRDQLKQLNNLRQKTEQNEKEIKRLTDQLERLERFNNFCLIFDKKNDYLEYIREKETSFPPEEIAETMIIISVLKKLLNYITKQTPIKLTLLEQKEVSQEYYLAESSRFDFEDFPLVEAFRQANVEMRRTSPLPPLSPLKEMLIQYIEIREAEKVECFHTFFFLPSFFQIPQCKKTDKIKAANKMLEIIDQLEHNVKVEGVKIEKSLLTPKEVEASKQGRLGNIIALAQKEYHFNFSAIVAETDEAQEKTPTP